MYAADKDGCVRDIPNSLLQKLSTDFPKFKIEYGVPQKGDATEISFNVGKGGCNSVASGDFNGDHKKDYAVLFVRTQDHVPWLFVSLASEDGWAITRLNPWCEVIRNCGVWTGKPGKYMHTMDYEVSADDPTEKTEAVSANQVVLAGTGMAFSAFIFQGNTWIHIPLTD
jgi:hypothetical protein